jgi:hypothetical protein
MGVLRNVKEKAADAIGVLRRQLAVITGLLTAAVALLAVGIALHFGRHA